MDKFVIVEKDGERLIVHPTTVESHQAAGWKVVGTSNSDHWETKGKPEKVVDGEPPEVKAPSGTRSGEK